MRVYRIVSFSVVILLVSVLFTGIVTVPAAAQYDMMQFHYNAQHTGDFSPVAGPVLSNGLLKWSFPTGYNYFSSPIVANGMVYVDGNYHNSNYAIDATNGTQTWSMEGDFDGSGSAAYANGVVYMLSEVWVGDPLLGGYCPCLFALNSTTGSEIWLCDLVNYLADGPIIASLTVSDSVVYLRSGNISFDPPVDMRLNRLIAVNATTGTIRWVDYPLTGTYSYSPTGLASPAVSNGAVFVGDSEGHFYAFATSNGRTLWNFTVGGSESSSPAVVGNVVYVASSNGSVYALNTSDGHKLWNYTTGYPIFSSPAYANGVVYLGSNDKNFYALNATTGAKLWNYTTGDSVWSSPSVANNVVYVGSNDKNVYALNATTGAKLWDYTTGGSVSSSPAIVNGVVYVGSGDGNVYAIGNQSAGEWGPWTNLGGQLLAGTDPAAYSSGGQAGWFVVGTNHQGGGWWT